MGHWNCKNRFEAILSGEKADRPIVSGWMHFIEREQEAEDFAKATISFTKKYDWDWVKINPRATYYSEVWGNEYNFQDYRNVFPKQTHASIKKPEDLWKITSIKAVSSFPLIEQLYACKQIREGLPDTPLVQTVFSPLTILLFLAGRSPYINETVYGSDKPLSLNDLFIENRAGVHHALHAISLTLADYIEGLYNAGIDGVFYAVTGTAHPELFDESSFNEFSRPYDSIVLDAASRRKVILHTCGKHAHPERFNDYRIDGISWDTEAEGNLSLEGGLNVTKVGGIDHTLFASNDIKKIQEQASSALKIMNDHPFILAPNCSIPINASDEALWILKKSIN
ncbi:uroporphyrinogen decarboxylase family protein [Cytobacillus massiliigabonensis]|uniref:uroporphyrinogen decarboxylase family protein n=1 Tax=Cytobacillus massiliigabonensis TaxID=1871011 RepID=UPI000C846680|nr:uroporphyrinogen decarboxylase family protein [Cytobacillus massiliigabonensis]